MLWGEPQKKFVEYSLRSSYDLAAMKPDIQKSYPFISGIYTTSSPPTDPLTVMQRADEVGAMQHMLSDAHTSAVMLIGNPGAGKSTLASLLYNRLLLAKQQGLSAPCHMVWLGLGTYTTLSDMIAAILNGVNIHDPGFFLLRPDQQISTLLRALRRPQDNALIVLDQFESLLYPEVNQAAAGRGVLQLFLEMLQTDLGASRILLTSYTSPYNEQMQESRVRSYLVSRISLPEGVALLQQRGVQRSQEELSLVWQRCAGHVFALVLFSALVNLSGIALSYLLNSPDYQPLWAGEVTFQLIASVYYFLSPVQYVLLRALSLFNEPVPLDGIMMAIRGDSTTDSNGRPLGAFERELAVLARLALVQVSSNKSNELCYTLHPLLHQYMLEHYLDTNERRRVEGLSSPGTNVASNPSPNSPESLQIALTNAHMQVAAYYQRVAREVYPPREQRQGLQDVQPLVSALRHLCLGGHWQRACDLLFEEGLHESMVQWGAWNTLIGLYTGLLPPFGVLLPRDEALISNHVGMLYGRMGEYQQSQAYFEQALAIQRQIGDRQGEATTLANQGELYRIRGEHALARENFERALSLNDEKQNLLLRCILLHNLGLLYQGKKHYAQAYDYYLESLHLVNDLKGQQNKGMILTNLGMLFYEQGRYPESIAILLTALHLRQTLQDPTAIMLEVFLRTLEQKMGAEVYARLCQSALEMQPEVFSRFAPLDMRQ